MSYPAKRTHAPLEPWLALLDGLLRFVASDGRTFISVPAASLDGLRTYSVRSDGFREWYFARSKSRMGITPSARTWSAICQHIESDAARDRRTRNVTVSCRVAQPAPGVLHVDLSNPEGEFIEITRDGHRVLTGETGAPFETSPTTRDLPAPRPSPAAAPDPLDTLRSILNLGPAGSSGWLRCLAWLLAAFDPSGPYPILVLRGPSASGKSLAGRILRVMVDPASAPFAPMPRSASQLLHFARHHWVLAFDHVSHLTPGIADAICRITSGAGLAWREPGRRDLVEHWIKRPVLLTVTENCRLPPDVASRALVVSLPELAPETRRCESGVIAAIEAVFPRVLDALCGAVSRALAAGRPSPPVPTRHAVVLSWAVAAFPDLESELRAAITEPPPAPAFVAGVRALVAHTPNWSGTAAALLQIVRAAETPKGVSQALNRHALALADAGIRIAFHRRHRGERIIALDASPDFSPPLQPPSPGPLTPIPKSNPILADPDAPPLALLPASTGSASL